MDVFMPVGSRGRREHDHIIQPSSQPKNIQDEIDQYFFAESELSQQMPDHNNATPAHPSTNGSSSMRVLRQRRPAHPINKINLFKLLNKISKRTKKIKLSPYHNYQKHLNIAIRHIVVLPALTDHSSVIEAIAHDLWDVFLVNESPTKKILHFVFNKNNEYQISESDLEQFGFDGVYHLHEASEVAAAKDYLTHLALQQLTTIGIDNYLQHRRLKDPVKFKKYLEVFQHQLQDGFLKKRFTNHFHKWEVKSLFEERDVQ